MNEGMFNEIKRRLDELTKLGERLVELWESQITGAPQVARDEAADKREMEKASQAKAAKAPEPIVQVDERTANEMERAGDFELVNSSTNRAQSSMYTSSKTTKADKK
jgi:hypothetical protein